MDSCTNNAPAFSARKLHVRHEKWLELADYDKTPDAARHVARERLQPEDRFLEACALMIPDDAAHPYAGGPGCLRLDLQPFLDVGVHPAQLFG